MQSIDNQLYGTLRLGVIQFQVGDVHHIACTCSEHLKEKVNPKLCGSLEGFAIAGIQKVAHLRSACECVRANGGLCHLPLLGRQQHSESPQKRHPFFGPVRGLPTAQFASAHRDRSTCPFGLALACRSLERSLKISSLSMSGFQRYQSLSATPVGCHAFPFGCASRTSRWKQTGSYRFTCQSGFHGSDAVMPSESMISWRCNLFILSQPVYSVSASHDSCRSSTHALAQWNLSVPP